MSENRRRRFQVILVVLCCALFSAPAVLNAAELASHAGKKAPVVHETVVLERNAEQKDPGATEAFDISSLFNKAAESCSGSCNCTSCTCSGSETCCAGGCGYCWGVLDGRGSC
jgi:hypothetical protein